MIIHWLVKVLTGLFVQLRVVLGHFDVEVGDPTQLPVYIALARELRVVRHASSFALILLEGVDLSLRFDQPILLLV